MEMNGHGPQPYNMKTWPKCVHANKTDEIRE